jgi:hypothetical protein
MLACCAGVATRPQHRPPSGPTACLATRYRRIAQAVSCSLTKYKASLPGTVAVSACEMRRTRALRVMAQLRKLSSRVNPSFGHFNEAATVFLRSGLFGPSYALSGELGELMELFCGHVALPWERRHPVPTDKAEPHPKFHDTQVCGNHRRDQVCARRMAPITSRRGISAHTADDAGNTRW